MKKNGFVLIETIVVIVVLSVALITIFSSYNKILTKVKSENKYDTSEYIYMTNYIKKYMKDNSVVTVNNIYPCNAGGCSTLVINNYYDNLKNTIPSIQNFNVKGIYLLTNLNKFDNEVNGVNNSLKFNANMIDYIRKLDVTDNETLLIVEYSRITKDRNYNDVEMVSSNTNLNGKSLNETFIASLEW